MPEKYLKAGTVGVTYNAGLTKVELIEGADDPDVYNGMNAASLWDTSTTSNTIHCVGTDEKYIGGSFANKTVITKIVYYAAAQHPYDVGKGWQDFAKRVRTSYFEASVDGENWVKVATIPGGSKEDFEMDENGVKVFELSVDDDTQYKYIRLVQPAGFNAYSWTVGVVKVVGVQYDAAGNLIEN